MNIEFNELVSALMMCGGFGFICGLLVAIEINKKKQN